MAAPESRLVAYDDSSGKLYICADTDVLIVHAVHMLQPALCFCCWLISGVCMSVPSIDFTMLCACMLQSPPVFCNAILICSCLCRAYLFKVSGSGGL